MSITVAFAVFSTALAHSSTSSRGDNDFSTGFGSEWVVCGGYDTPMQSSDVARAAWQSTFMEAAWTASQLAQTHTRPAGMAPAILFPHGAPPEVSFVRLPQTYATPSASFISASWPAMSSGDMPPVMPPVTDIPSRVRRVEFERPAYLPKTDFIKWGKSRPDQRSTASKLLRDAAAVPAGPDSTRKVMLRDIPNDFTRAQLVRMLNAKGLKGTYDFLYLPIDLHRDSNLGYAFVNFNSAEEATIARRTLDEFSDWTKENGDPMNSEKILKTAPAHENTGGIDRWRHSPMCHPDVPEGCQPLCFDLEGNPIAYRSLYRPHRPVAPPRRRLLDNVVRQAGGQSLL